MYRQTNLPGARETLVVTALAIVLGGAVFAFVLMLGGLWFVAMLGVVAVVSVVGLLHYAVWGRSAQRHDRDALRYRAAPSRRPPARSDDTPWPPLKLTDWR